MAELESVIEKRLIDQLCEGESQWTYRPDIRNEEQLWANFKYILEQNNKAVLNGVPLSDSEFEKIKNDVSHASFYEAGKWLVGEQGRVYVHIQRGNEKLHLVVLNNEHIAGGTSVYEVINQYQAFKADEKDDTKNRRFDVTLLINGIPLIHIELKNKDHSYMEGFYQIKNYIAEGKFRGLFSNIQMFVVSNVVDTKYFAPARDTELKKEFLSGWLDSENYPVCDFVEFTKKVLRIPEAHEMVARYTVLDEESKKIILLRPYQIHAIEAMRKASKKGISGYIWHTTGSGKTLTSYKSTRNLLMDIPSIEKTIFLIDRKDLDDKTTMDFQSYAVTDTIDVDETENVTSLINKLSDGNRQMIVTTRQKMQHMMKRLTEDSPKYKKIKGLKVAFVVDECHRAVSPETKRQIENFFDKSLWYGFTGTPIFDVNAYEQKGDLPRTTEQLYGPCLHSYTIKEAIHDEAVLGFMVENLGTQVDVDNPKVYESEEHMRKVLNIILNKSAKKLALQNGRGKTYEAILTASSIAQAQRYYELLKRVKEGNDELKINEDIKKALPDFPKFAITYSLSENEESSQNNQEKMKEALDDYNEMFGTKYKVEDISVYNKNLNERLTRKKKVFHVREQQLDLVIVVDRLLTGFDAPCLSTLFMDRQPMQPQDLIQAFSRTNRLYDKKNKEYGQIVTFQSPKDYKEQIDAALRLYSRGGEGQPVSEDWETVREKFYISLKAVRNLMEVPDASILSNEQKKAYIHLFRALDNTYAHLKSFSKYDETIIEEMGFSDEEYTDYAAIYKNIIQELKSGKEGNDDGEKVVVDNYELVAVNSFKVDYEYIINLIQDIVELIEQPDEEYSEEEFIRNTTIIRGVIDDFAVGNAKIAALLNKIIDDIVEDKHKYAGENISVILNRMCYDAIDKEVKEFASKWYLPEEDVKYEVFNYRDGVIANENNLKEKIDYAGYKANTEEPLNKIKIRKMMVEDFRNNLMVEIEPLLL